MDFEKYVEELAVEALAAAEEGPESGAADFAISQANDTLGGAGIRFVSLNGTTVIGVWSDLDGPKIRAALRMLGMDRLPIRYLDGAGIPAQYKLRLAAGEPVPMKVLDAMERHRDAPWQVRDRMLKEMAWCHGAGTRAEA